MDALQGVKVVELPGLAPVPFCGKILADFGADVTFVEKLGGTKMPVERKMMENKKRIALDFKKDLAKLRELVLSSDVLLDPYRPGVLEQIGLDPVQLLEENKSLIVARISGFGQTGPYRSAAGHDINYVALSGIMPLISGPNRPYWPPANLIADFAGGSLTCAFGICAALIKRHKTGQGSIIDLSMTEGAAYLASYIYAYQADEQLWDPDYGFFSGRCPIFRTFETKDGKFVSCGALEPKFHSEVFRVLQIDPSEGSQQDLIQQLEAEFKTKTRDEWQNIFENVDSCVAPVLDINEVGSFEQHKARGAFQKVNGLWQPRPAPRIYSKDEFKRLSKL